MLKNPFRNKKLERDEFLKAEITALKLSMEHKKREYTFDEGKIFCHGVLSTLAIAGYDAEFIDHISKGLAKYVVAMTRK